MKTKAKIKVDGLHCNACALTTDDAVEQLEGVHKSKTNVARATTKVTYDSRAVSLEQIHQAITDAGYTPQVFGPDASSSS